MLVVNLYSNFCNTNSVTSEEGKRTFLNVVKNATNWKPKLKAMF